MEFREALTFDDVLLAPAESAVLPNQTDTTTQLTKNITAEHLSKAWRIDLDTTKRTLDIHNKENVGHNVSELCLSN